MPTGYYCHQSTIPTPQAGGRLDSITASILRGVDHLTMITPTTTAGSICLKQQIVNQDVGYRIKHVSKGAEYAGFRQ
ncbi:MAG: hypothetical protein U1E88_05780 [Acinetobacter sp.]